MTGGAVLVLGGTGFVASHLCRALVRAGRPVRIFARLHSDRKLIADIESSVEIVQGDIGRAGDVERAMDGIRTIVHFVHTTVPGSSMLDPAYDVQSNVAANVQWMRRLDASMVEEIMYVSSGGTVYGRPMTSPITESHPTEPISSYGITKLALEKYVAMFATRAGRRHVIVRPSNVYGPGQRLDIGQGFIGVGLEQLLAGKPVEIWGDGSVVRDYVFVEDVVAAMLALLEKRGDDAIFNIGSGDGHSLKEVAEELLRAAGATEASLVYGAQRTFDVPANVLDITRLHRATGWSPTVSLSEGITRTAEWIRTRARS